MPPRKPLLLGVGLVGFVLPSILGVDAVAPGVCVDDSGEEAVEAGGDLLDGVGVLDLDHILLDGLVVVEEPGHGAGQEDHAVQPLDGFAHPLGVLRGAQIGAGALALIDAHHPEGGAVDRDGLVHGVGKGEQILRRGRAQDTDLIGILHIQIGQIPPRWRSHNRCRGRTCHCPDKSGDSHCCCHS